MQDTKEVTIEDLMNAKPDELEELFQTIMDGLKIYEYHDDRKVLNKAKDLFTEHNMMFEAAKMTREIGISYYRKGERKKGLRLIENAVDILKNIKKNDKRDEVLFSYITDIAIGNYQSLNYAKSSVNFEECSKMVNDKLPTRELFRYHLDYAILCIYIEQFDKALELLNNALQYTEDNNIKKGKIHNEFGRCYWRMKEFIKSLEMYSKAKEFYGDNKNKLATLYNNMSLVYNALGEHDKAMELINKCLEIFDKNNPRKHLIYYDTYVRIAIDSEELDELINRLLNVIKIANSFSYNKIHVIDPILIIVKKLKESRDVELGMKLRSIIIGLIEEVGEVEYRDYYENQLYACLGELSYLLGVKNKI